MKLNVMQRKIYISKANMIALKKRYPNLKRITIRRNPRSNKWELKP